MKVTGVINPSMGCEMVTLAELYKEMSTSSVLESEKSSAYNNCAFLALELERHLKTCQTRIDEDKVFANALWEMRTCIRESQGSPAQGIYEEYYANISEYLALFMTRR